jgi:hypothetical protein
VATDNGPDPFAAQGGGRFVEGVGWVDKNNPAYAQGQATTTLAPGATTPGQADQTAPSGATTSATPGAPPTTNTTNQGVQDTVRNTYLEQATQSPIPKATDPTIAAQVDPYRAEIERQKNDYINQQAESAGPYATGALRGQERAASEHAGQAVASFAGQAVGNELVARRQEIQQALSGLTGLLDADQTRALQQKLADIDAQLKTLGISTGATTAENQLGVQKELGIGNLNLGMINALLNNQQFGDQLGFNIADREAYYNNLAAQQLLGGG